MRLSSARICVVAPEFIGPFPNGGVGTACYWEASTLASAGFDVTVLYTGPTDRETPEHWERAYAAGPFAYVDLSRWAGPHLEAVDRVQHPCAEARTAELVFRCLRDKPFDLVLFQEFLGHGSRTLQARRSGEALVDTPVAVTLHSCRQWIYEGMRRLPASRGDLYVDFLERESARLADYVIAPSRHMSQWAAAHWRMEQPAPVVPYCYDARLAQPAARVRHDGPFRHLVFFGRLETRKGLHLFCRALAQHPESLGSVNRITFLGKASTVEGRPSEEFIRSTLGGLTGVDIEIISDLGSLEALDWLSRQQLAIVAAPSVADNLPYAVIELFARRLPVVSTRVGGIPEIAGSANEHVLAEPTAEGLAAVFSRIHRDGHLTIDYRDGYSIEAANVSHVAFVRQIIEQFAAPVRAAVNHCSVVFVDVASEDVPAARERFVAADPTALDASFLSWSAWWASDDRQTAVFASAAITPRSGLVGRLRRALADPRVIVATSYFACDTPAGIVSRAPLGGSLEAGWTGNVFGGPCFAAKAAAFDALRLVSSNHFEFWPAYVAMSCTDFDLTVVPHVLFTSNRDSAIETLDATEAVAQQYGRQSSRRFDLGWVLKYASPAERARAGVGAPQGTEPSAGRALYEHLLAIPDAALQAYSGLIWTPTADPFAGEIRTLRKRLSELAARWHTTDPRVLVYGAGQHTRLLLALEPELGRFIAGFIDRRPVGEFLGKPCIAPEEVTPAIADVLLYSSREFERDMHARLAHIPVQHELLYAAPTGSAPDTTSTRVRRRLGHDRTAVDGLRGMYRPPEWVRGGCSGGDVEFLLELVAGLAPRLVLELGVASGTSSAALLFALDQLPAIPAGRRLHSADVRGTCYFDELRATGSAVEEMYPQRRTPWLLDTNSDARRIRESLIPGMVDLAFIDANHCHPWPLLDLLHIAPWIRPASWIALHDIELPRLHPQFQVHGPQWLFEAWPFNKIHGVDGSVNIGAVQLPAKLSDLVPVALTLLDRTWEHTPTTWDIDLPEVFARVARAVAPRLRKLAPAPAALAAAR